MNKLVIAVISIMIFNTIFGEQAALCKSNNSSQKYSKASEYNNRGQKVGYYKVYSSGDKVTKVEKYSTSGKRVQKVRYN